MENFKNDLLGDTMKYAFRPYGWKVYVKYNKKTKKYRIKKIVGVGHHEETKA